MKSVMRVSDKIGRSLPRRNNSDIEMGVLDSGGEGEAERG